MKKAPLSEFTLSVVVALGFGLVWSDTYGTVSSTELRTVSSEANSEKIQGMCYGPHRANENPEAGVNPTRIEMEEDLSLIAHLTDNVRTYGVTGNLESIPDICHDLGIGCYPGAWISRYACDNDREVEFLINIGNENWSTTKGLIVGNEVLLRGDLSEEQLLAYIAHVKSSTSTPVATAETWKDWLDHPQIAEAVDIMFVHIYPYWDGVAIEDAMAYLSDRWREVQQAYPGKEMVIGETGWPSAGEARGNAVPSPENQRQYFFDFVAMADSIGISYYFFEVFDEPWKAKGLGEGAVGAHWGIFDSSGTLKTHMVGAIPDSAQQGRSRSLRQIDAEQVSFPLTIYTDACSEDNRFVPSGWMGELSTYTSSDSVQRDPTEVLNEAWTEDPFTGESCIRVSYSPSFDSWGGIYWQFPVNNGGAYPGYDLSGAASTVDSVVCSFYARGHSGGERVEFITGNINDETLPYYDSFGRSTGVVTLTSEWRPFSLDLTGMDLSMVIGGFAWVTNYSQNPSGCTFYIDEVSIDAPILTSVGDESDVSPRFFELNQNFPNPFNSSTGMSYTLTHDSEVRLDIFNALGQRVETLFSGFQERGSHTATWVAARYSSGIYYYRLKVPGLVETRKMILLK